MSWQVVARIGKLEKLNGSAVSAAERQDAEIRYLRRATGGAPVDHQAAALSVPQMASYLLPVFFCCLRTLPAGACFLMQLRDTGHDTADALCTCGQVTFSGQAPAA